MRDPLLTPVVTQEFEKYLQKRSLSFQIWYRVSYLSFRLTFLTLSVVCIPVCIVIWTLFKLPLIYNIWKLCKSYLCQLTRHNNGFPISSCLFISELTLKTVFGKNHENPRWISKIATDPKNSEFWCFCTTRSRKTPVPNTSLSEVMTRCLSYYYSFQR